MSANAEIFLLGAGLAYAKPNEIDSQAIAKPSAFAPSGLNLLNLDPLPQEMLAALQGTDEAAMIQELDTALPQFKPRRAPSGVKLALLATSRACLAADLAPTALPEQNCGLYIGTESGAAENTLNFIDGILIDGPRLASPTFFSHSVSNTFAGMLAVTLGLHGPAITCSQGELSLYGALLSAWLDLAAGETDLALLGVIEETHSMLATVRTFNNYPQCRVAHAAFFLLSRHKKPGAARIAMPVLNRKSYCAEV